MRIAAPIALLALGATFPVSAAEEIPRQVDLAEAEIAGWTLVAWIDVDRAGYYPDGDLPVIGAVVCEMVDEQELLELRLYSLGGVSLAFEDGEFETSEITSLAIGDTTWEYRETVISADREFVDIDYPPPPVVEPCGGRKGHDIILYGCPQEVKVSAPRVRRSADEPWLGLTTLANELFGASSIRIAYRPDEQTEGQERVVELSLDGLKQAAAWCEATIQSDAARRVRPVSTSVTSSATRPASAN